MKASLLHPLASLASAAGDEAFAPATVDSLIGAWLFETGRLDTKGEIDDPEAPAPIAILPGWCGKASLAERLQMNLLPGWRFELAGGGLAALRPPAGCVVTCRVNGDGPTLARAIIAATFNALMVLDALTKPVDSLRALRAAFEAASLQDQAANVVDMTQALGRERARCEVPAHG